MSAMRISTRGRYAVRVMLDLALYGQGEYVKARQIAKRQGISEKYLEQIIPILNKSGFLLASRGFQGGYRLAKTPDKYTVGDILRATEGSLSPVACLDNEPVLCQRADMCTTLSVWKGLKKVIDEYVDGITLQDLLDQQRETYANDYVI